MSSFNAKSSYSFTDGFHADTMHNPIGPSFCLSSLPGEDERLARLGSSDKPKMILILPANNSSSPFPPKELVLITGVFAKNFTIMQLITFISISFLNITTPFAIVERSHLVFLSRQSILQRLRDLPRLSNEERGLDTARLV